MTTSPPTGPKSKKVAKRESVVSVASPRPFVCSSATTRNLPVQIARPPRQFVGESRALVGKNWDAVAFKSREKK